MTQKIDRLLLIVGLSKELYSCEMDYDADKDEISSNRPIGGKDTPGVWYWK